MPTALDRIQCLMQPATYAAVMTLVNVTGKTKSNMAAELIEHALKDEKYKALLAEADGAQTVKPKEDPRTESRQKSFHRQPSKAVKEEAENISYQEMVNTQARPVFSPEEQSKLFSMVAAGVITKEKAVEMMSYQPPAPGQDKEEKQADMRQEMLSALGEQDDRLSRMEALIAQLVTSAKS